MYKKQLLSLVLALVMIFSLTACAGAPASAPEPTAAPAPAPSALYKTGVYTASAEGMEGPVKVEVTVSESEITAIKVTEQNETPAIGGAAIEPMTAKLLEAQSIEVDGESGATITSDAIKAAVKKCLDEAMGIVPAGATGYTPGAYSATVQAHNGEMTVEVTVDETSITAVSVKEHKETYGLGYGLVTSPIEVLPEAIVKTQSLNVDAVASATITSAAIKQAVAACVTEAGGDAEALKAVPVEKPASTDETFDVDVVVIGAGAAGLAAANTALEAGAKTLIIEKVGITGGSTTRSGGKILGAGTPWQEAQGQKDNADMMYDYLMEFTRDNYINPELLRPFCDNSAANIDWLVDRGVQVQDVEPIHSSLSPMRVHNTKGGGGMISGIGGQICVPLTNAYEKAGGEIIYNCRATELITNDSGAVVGVKAEKAGGGTVSVNAGAVILCTGGYAHNEEMLDKYEDFLPNNMASGVPMTNVGDGLVMATAVGAKNFDAPGLQLVYVNYDAYVGIAEEAGLIVDVKGNRVVDEWTYQSHVAQALADAKSPNGYYITATKGGVCAEPYPTVQYGVTLPSVPQAASLAELAAVIGMESAALEATVAHYNELCAKGKDADFNKPAEYMIPVEGDMYYAFKMNPGSSVTFGGLETDTSARVLSVKGEPIPGLYAAGEVAFTGLFGAEYPCCGMAIGSAVYFGRAAATHATAK